MTENQNTNDRSGEFIANLLHNLSKNGFPEKKVSLPLDKLYESAHNKGVNFNKVLTFLKEEKDIDHEKTSTRILFFPLTTEENPSSAGTAPDASTLEQMMKLGQHMFGDTINPEEFANSKFDFASMSKKVTEMLSTMTPEQLKNLQDMVTSMPENQKNDLLKKARDLGLK